MHSANFGLGASKFLQIFAEYLKFTARHVFVNLYKASNENNNKDVHIYVKRCVKISKLAVSNFRGKLCLRFKVYTHPIST